MTPDYLPPTNPIVSALCAVLGLAMIWWGVRRGK